MAITFNTNIASAYMGLGFNPIMIPTNGASISVYSGARPTAATLASNWSSYNSNTSSFLLPYFAGGTNAWVFSSVSNSWALVPSLYNNFIGSILHTGTATWAVIWGAYMTTISNYNTATLPTTNFIVVDVSDSTGTGTLRLNNTTFTVGSAPPAWYDGTIAATSP